MKMLTDYKVIAYLIYSKIGVVNNHASHFATRWGHAILQGFLPFDFQEAVREAYVDVAPRVLTLKRNGAEENIWIQTRVFHTLKPEVVIELIIPAIKARAALPGRVNDAADATVTARNNSFQVTDA